MIKNFTVAGFFLLTLNVSLTYATQDVSLKDCDNLSIELHYEQPPVLSNDTGAVGKYRAMMDKCETLRKSVKCDKDTRFKRSEMIFLIVVRGEKMENISLEDYVTAEHICSAE